ncbi:Rep family protein [Coprococcus sp. RTP21204st1_G4_RTP21204_210225]|uniref:Rep family protein n=1 Tax=Coprococcus sp. RTP21204st1_G4_RTP21204_210225 TaxID=3143207 RepID=UPI0034A12F95
MARSEAQKRADKKYEKKRVPRKDYWLFEFYPDSAPENWREIINSWLVDCLVSPLHDSDVNEDGTPKKPHWHGILFFDSVKSFEPLMTGLAFDGFGIQTLLHLESNGIEDFLFRAP